MIRLFSSLFPERRICWKHTYILYLLYMKRFSGSEDIIWQNFLKIFKLLLWPWPWTQQSTSHMPLWLTLKYYQSLVAKGSHFRKITVQSYCDYMSLHCDPHLEDGKPTFLHDTQAHEHHQSYQVPFLQKVQCSRRHCPDNSDTWAHWQTDTVIPIYLYPHLPALNFITRRQKAFQYDDVQVFSPVSGMIHSSRFHYDEKLRPHVVLCTGTHVHFTYYYNCIVAMGSLPWETRVAFPRGKASRDRVALPNLWCMLGVLVFPWSTDLWHGLQDLYKLISMSLRKLALLKKSNPKFPTE